MSRSCTSAVSLNDQRMNNMPSVLEKLQAKAKQIEASKLRDQLRHALPNNPAAAKAARDSAIDQVAQGASAEWMAAAIQAVRDVAHKRETFTTDALWALIPQPREPRALGPAMQQARRYQLCEPTDMTRCSGRTACHARPLRVWRSLIWNGNKMIGVPE